MLSLHGVGCRAQAADNPGAFPGLRELMTAEELRATGVDSLNPRQLRALDAWLLLYLETRTDNASAPARPAAAPPATTASGRAPRRSDETGDGLTGESRIVGEFDGWWGDTVFELENGQRWRQRLDGRYFYNGPPNPRVRISRNFLGFYKLTLIDRDHGIGVTPLP